MNNTEICQSALQARNIERLNNLNNLFELGMVAMTNELQQHRDAIESVPSCLTQHEIDLAAAKERTAPLYKRLKDDAVRSSPLIDAIRIHCANARLLQNTL